MPPTGSRHAASASPPLPPPSSFPAIHPSLARCPTATRRLRSRAVACVGIVAFLALSAHHAVARAASAEVSDAVGIVDPFAVFIAEASLRFGLPASGIRAVIQAESRGDARAVSPKGAMGLMQIMPETWSGLRFRYGLGTDPFDPHDNIVAGTAYLRELHDRYGDPGFLAAYSAGPARYEAHLAAGLPLPDETRAYVSLLAPLTAADRAGDGAVLATALRSWTEAPLFVMHADGSPTASRLSPAVQYERRSAAVPAIDWTGLAPQSGGLFVPTPRRNRSP